MGSCKQLAKGDNLFELPCNSVWQLCCNSLVRLYIKVHVIIIATV